MCYKAIRNIMKNKYTNPPTISLLPTSISLTIEADTAEIANIATVVAVIKENKSCCAIPNTVVNAIRGDHKEYENIYSWDDNNICIAHL